MALHVHDSTDNPTKREGEFSKKKKVAQKKKDRTDMGGKRQQRDFKKIKEKGYGKKVKPANKANVSFKTKALVMPYQKLADESRQNREDVTKRNLSLDELLAKVTHHSFKV